MNMVEGKPACFLAVGKRMQVLVLCDSHPAVLALLPETRQHQHRVKTHHAGETGLRAILEANLEEDLDRR